MSFFIASQLLSRRLAPFLSASRLFSPPCAFSRRLAPFLSTSRLASSLLFRCLAPFLVPLAPCALGVSPWLRLRRPCLGAFVALAVSAPCTPVTASPRSVITTRYYKIIKNNVAKSCEFHFFFVILQIEIKYTFDKNVYMTCVYYGN